MRLSGEKRKWLLDRVEVWLKQTQPELIELKQDKEELERELLLECCEVYEKYRPSDEELDALEKYGLAQCQSTFEIELDRRNIVLLSVDKSRPYRKRADGFKWPIHKDFTLNRICSEGEAIKLEEIALAVTDTRKAFYKKLASKLEVYREFINKCNTLKQVAVCWPPAEGFAEAMQQKFHNGRHNKCSVPINLDTEAQMRMDLIEAGLLEE